MKIKIFFILYIIIFFNIKYGNAQSVSINDNGDLPNSNAMLDVDISTNNKGIIIPRLTTAQRNAMTLGLDDEALTVYDTDTKTYWFWEGAGWVSIMNETYDKHFVGELYGGGIVFYINEDGLSGLIISIEDLNNANGSVWSNITSIEIGASAQDYYQGGINTTGIINQAGHTNSAAQFCEDYVYDGFSDWYLPSIVELREIDKVVIRINNVLENDGDPNTYGIKIANIEPYSRYWSSTEDTNANALYYYFCRNVSNSRTKGTLYNFRAIRSF